jgi:DNA modification methylase
MELNKIYNENCLDTMARMPNNFIDLTVTSPPYDNLRNYNGYSFDFESVAKELYRITKEGGVVVWVVSDATINGNETGTSFKQALFFKECGFNLHDTMIYYINGTGAKGSNLAYWQSFEYMFILTKGKPKTVNRIADKKNKNAGKKRGSKGSNKLNKIGTRTERIGVLAPEYSIRANVWMYNVGQNDKTIHPAVFPEELVRDHIYTWSNEGDLVYDCFMGSGTTAKMSHIYKREWLGSELSEEYIKDAERRLSPYLTQQTLF